MATHTHRCTCGQTLTATSAVELTQAQATHTQLVHGALTRHGGARDGRTGGSAR